MATLRAGRCECDASAVTLVATSSEAAQKDERNRATRARALAAETHPHPPQNTLFASLFLNDKQCSSKFLQKKKCKPGTPGSGRAFTHSRAHARAEPGLANGSERKRAGPAASAARCAETKGPRVHPWPRVFRAAAWAGRALITSAGTEKPNGEAAGHRPIGNLMHVTVLHLVGSRIQGVNCNLHA